MTQRPKRLLDQVRDAIRLKHYAYSTEKAYVYWAKRFILYHTSGIYTHVLNRSALAVRSPLD